MYALMAAFFHYTQWQVDEMSNEEVQMYLAQLGEVRALRDFAVNRAAFGQISEEGRKAMLQPSTGPDDTTSRAWQAYLKPYQAAEKAERVEPLKLSPGVAEAMVSWIESGEFSRGEHAADVWRMDMMTLWPRLLASLQA